VAIAGVKDGEVEEVADARLDVAEAAEEATEALLDDTDETLAVDDTDETLAADEADPPAVELETIVEVGTGDDTDELPTEVEDSISLEEPEVMVVMIPPSGAAGAEALVTFWAAAL